MRQTACNKAWAEKDLGGYSNGAPPLPIPNREVKPISADGTAYSGRVSRRHSLIPVQYETGIFYFQASF
jgi:hypothetical protein